MSGKGLYKRLYGDVGSGKYDSLYAYKGSPIAVKRFESRLGQADMDKSFFSRTIAGLPVWLISFAGLGFVWAYKKVKEKDIS